jgi:ABC-type uncharacterized transport system YnjBCD permease subunit
MGTKASTNLVELCVLGCAVCVKERAVLCFCCSTFGSTPRSCAGSRKVAAIPHGFTLAIASLAPHLTIWSVAHSIHLAVKRSVQLSIQRVVRVCPEIVAFYARECHGRVLADVAAHAVDSKANRKKRS